VTEHILANTLPVLIPPMLLRTHIITTWSILAWTFLEISTVHSGFSFSKLARRHDAHHEKFNVFFGYLGLLDRLHGTDGRHDEKEKHA
jgi:methylsterol monooxygenase